MTGEAQLLARITVRPEVLGGKPIIRDMRISVELILSLLAQGSTQEELLDDYPFLESEDIRACIAYAHAVISGAPPAAALAPMESVWRHIEETGITEDDITGAVAWSREQ